MLVTFSLSLIGRIPFKSDDPSVPATIFKVSRFRVLATYICQLSLDLKVTHMVYQMLPLFSIRSGSQGTRLYF